MGQTAEDRCDNGYERGEITGIVSPRCVEVDGMPKDVNNLRPRALSECSCALSAKRRR